MREFLKYFNDHFFLFFMCLGLLLVISIASKINKKDKKILIIMIISILLLSTFEFLEILFDDNHLDYENYPRYLFSFITYSLRPVIIVLFYYLRMNIKNKKRYLLWIGVVINTIIYSFLLFSYKNPSMQFVVWYNSSNIFDRTFLGFTVHAICAIYLILLIIISIVDTKINKTRKQVNIIIIFTIIQAIIVQTLSMVLDLSYSYTQEAYAFGAALFFMYLSYDRAYNDAIKHEREMRDKTTALMLSQIKPHFIYNTLATIQVLCDIDPALASKTIDSFSKYLRMNTDALNKTEPVSILDEIKHAKAYAEIEMIRFDNIEVKFDILDNDFKLPVLTIEPILENSIKYGVRARQKGIVEIKTYKDNNNHILLIKDNGIGFDINKINNDNKNHVGISNVKTRIENMVKGKFEIESIVDSGTTVKITIPEE